MQESMWLNFKEFKSRTDSLKRSDSKERVVYESDITSSLINMPRNVTHESYRMILYITVCATYVQLLWYFLLLLHPFCDWTLQFPFIVIAQNDMRMSKWHNFHFWVNYFFKDAITCHFRHSPIFPHLPLFLPLLYHLSTMDSHLTFFCMHYFSENEMIQREDKKKKKKKCSTSSQNLISPMMFSLLTWLIVPIISRLSLFYHSFPFLHLRRYCPGWIGCPGDSDCT